MTYLHAALYALRINTRHIKQSTGIQNLDSSSYLDVEVGFPCEIEQHAIATFLDRETARIDALVAKKQRLIALLQEQRTALITRAVTQGLNPSVPMKDSGFEWSGEIPAHWETSFLDKLIDPQRRITYGIVQPGETDPNGIPMVRGQNYSRGWSSIDEIFHVSHEIEAPYRRARLRPGDIVMTIVGAGTGNVAIVPDWLAGANLTQTTARIALNFRRGNNRYFAYQLQSVIGKSSVELTVKGAAQPGLNLGHIAKYRVIVPSPSEQALIADYLDRKTSSVDALIGKVRQAIYALHELRSALISAAVTGKIDVREEVR
jgi:type I restriction enzyme S subunit